MQNYHLEFILHVIDTPLQTVKSSLAEFSEGLEITDSQVAAADGKNIKIKMLTEDPTVIFDLCAQFGRIKSAKIEEIK